MKKLLSLIIVFTISVSAFAATKTGYYQAGQTKATVLANAKTYENDMLTYKYKVTAQTRNSTYDYSQTWEYMSAGATSLATVRYQFLEDRILITMSNAAFISKEGLKIPLIENDPTEVKRKVYESLENVLVSVCFKYLQVSETPPSAQRQSSTGTSAATYDFINGSYLAGEDKAASKKYSAEYVDKVLKKAYDVNYLTSTTADTQQIKYTLEDASGVATIIMDYQFRDKDFNIMIKSIEYYHKETKATTKISKESSTDATSKFYNLVKDYFIDNHANYIAPGLVSKK